MPAATNKPIIFFRLRGVKVSVFANVVNNGQQDMLFHKVSLQRVYRDGEEWKTTRSLGRDDIPVACLLLQKAWEFVLDREAGSAKARSEERERQS